MPAGCGEALFWHFFHCTSASLALAYLSADAASVLQMCRVGKRILSPVRLPIPPCPLVALEGISGFSLDAAGCRSSEYPHPIRIPKLPGGRVGKVAFDEGRRTSKRLRTRSHPHPRKNRQCCVPSGHAISQPAVAPFALQGLWRAPRKCRGVSLSAQSEYLRIQSASSRSPVDASAVNPGSIPELWPGRLSP